MKKFYVVLFLVIFLFGCVKQQIQETPGEKAEEETADISETAGILDVGAIDEELDVESLGTLEEDLEYIENI